MHKIMHSWKGTLLAFLILAVFVVLQNQVFAKSAVSSGSTQITIETSSEASPETALQELPEGTAAEAEGEHSVAFIFLALAIIVIVSKLGATVEHLGQPAVLGEILVGVILGNLYLLGFDFFQQVESNEVIKFLAEFGVVILLFQIGLESNVKQLGKTGLVAFIVAVAGVITPLVVGTYLVGPWLLPEMSFAGHLFIGSALTATSVGITARIFKDLGKLHTKEAQIVLGAAVIDDVLGLLVLAVVTAIVQAGSVSFGEISLISAKALGFLVGAIIVGQLCAPWIGALLSKIHHGVGMKFGFAISFGLLFAYLAALVGLAPIVGAFAAGLVLDPVHFKGFQDFSMVRDLRAKIASLSSNIKQEFEQIIDHHSHRHIEDLMEGVGYLFVPLFFVLTGMQVKLSAFSDTSILGIAFAITVLAFLSKLICGLFVKKGTDRWIVGFAMAPRGEVGLIFANIGKSLGVIGDDIFAVIVIVVMMTTLVTPPLLTQLLKRLK